MYAPISLPAYQAAEKGFEKSIRKETAGSASRWKYPPSFPPSSKCWVSKTVLMGFGLESNAIHSPNENIPLDIFRKGIEAVVEFYLNYKIKQENQDERLPNSSHRPDVRHLS